MGSKTFLGFVAGMSVGMVIGILFAPDKGSDTRKKISDKTGDFSDSVKKSFGDFIDKLKESIKGKSTETGEFAEKDFNIQQNHADAPSH